MKNTERKHIVPVLAFVVAYALAFSIASDFERTYSPGTAPASQLIASFVDKSVELELSCNYFKQCLHLEVIDTAQCKDSLMVQINLRDLFDRYITSEQVITPSPKNPGGFIVEIGTNMRPEISAIGVVRLRCSKSAPNVIAAG